MERLERASRTDEFEESTNRRSRTRNDVWEGHKRVKNNRNIEEEAPYLN